MSVEEMDLQPDVAEKACELQRLHPQVVFTSGRRTLAQQAHAMAVNVMQNRRYITETYRASTAELRLQVWVTRHPEAKTVEAIAAGLLEVLHGLKPEDQLSLSRHLTGRAFDVKPHSCPVEAIQALHPKQFLEREGDLERWHVGF